MIMNKAEYIKAIKRVGYGYLFTLLNINLGTINILPNWVGYLLFNQSIEVISKQERSTVLLKPLSIFLGIYELIVWCLAIVNIQIDNYIIIVIVTIISLYFDFQFLTNIAELAKKHGSIHAKRIIELRTIDVVFSTIMALPFQWNSFLWVIIIVLLLELIIALWICRIMFVYAEEEKNLIYEVRKD